MKHEHEEKNILESDIKILVPDCQVGIYYFEDGKMKNKKTKLWNMQLIDALQNPEM